MTGPSPLLAAALVPGVIAHGDRFTWDEGLMVAAPIAVFAAVLVTANRRASALQARRDAGLGERVEHAGEPAEGDGAPHTTDGDGAPTAPEPPR